MINSLDCTTLMLVLDDIVEENDSEQDLEVKAMFIEFVKLCQIFEGIVTLRYSTSGTDAAPPDQLRVCENALEDWIRSLPAQAKRQEHLQTMSGNLGVATMYRAILHAGFNTIRIALYQSHTLWNGADDWITMFQEKVEFAALDNTQLFSHLVNLDLVKFCPTIAVTFTLAPLIVHVLGIRSAKSEERLQVHKNRFDLCMIFLRQLRDIYWHAIFYCDFFELAASIKERRLMTHMSEAQDPLASFLTQRISVGDQLILQHYQSLGRTGAGAGKDGLLSSRASPSSGSYQQQWTPNFGAAIRDTNTQSPDQAGPSMMNIASAAANPSHGYSDSVGAVNLNEWLATYGQPGHSVPFA